jgi:small subunit ribosomal protein S7
VERKDREGKKINMSMKIFDLYETEQIVINDPGLKRVINVSPKLVLKTHGRKKGGFAQTKVNIVERLVNLVGVPGHRGKKHKIMTGRAAGKYNKNMQTVLKALKIVEEKTKENPVQVLVKAVEKASPREEVTTIEYGGAKYPQAVDCSPIRRVNITLRLIAHGAYDKSFGKKTKIYEALANEIILAANEAPESAAMAKKNEMEKQANSAR